MVRSCCGTQGRKAGKTGTPSCVLSTVASPPAGSRTRELREVARLKGIKPDKLAKPVADQLKKAFK